MKAIDPKCIHNRGIHKQYAKYLRRDCFMLNFIESFMESVPQLAVQLYITVAFERSLSVLLGKIN